MIVSRDLQLRVQRQGLQADIDQADVVRAGFGQRHSHVQAQLSCLGLSFDCRKSDVPHRRGILPEEKLLHQCLDLLVANGIHARGDGAGRYFSKARHALRLGGSWFLGNQVGKGIHESAAFCRLICRIADRATGPSD